MGKNTWSKEEDEFLKENYGKIDSIELSSKLFEINGYKYSRDTSVVQARAKKLEITSKDNSKNARLKIQNASENLVKKYQINKLIWEEEAKSLSRKEICFLLRKTNRR